MIEIVREQSHEKYYIADLSGEKTLLALLQEQGIPISAPCDGKGTCGKCRIQFLTGAPEITEKERKLLRSEELRNGIRLACTARVKESCRIVLIENREENVAVLTDFGEQKERVLFGQSVCTQPDAKNDGQVYGIAIDIGTTTLAAELFDLSDGRKIAHASGINHQRAFGADVITRIAAANAGKKELLCESIRSDIVMLLNELAERAWQEASVPEILNAVSEIAIVGNTTMCHLLRGLSCEGLGCAPFTPTDITWFETSAAWLLGLRHCPAKVTILPGISAFVGADIVAGIYASEPDRKTGANLLLDIGTNGEMALYHEGRFYVTSTASGPVFEGGNISCGMPSVPGAIYCIKGYTAEHGWDCKTIGNQPAIGLCGTGIIDLTAALWQAGYMDEYGTLEEPWFTDGVWINDKISFGQDDIREVQMGKAAIRAGIEILLKEIKSEQLHVSLAGGFGHYIDEEHAILIGMFPQKFRGHINSVGNSALNGAKQYLLATEEGRTRIDWIVANAVEWNLAENALFEELYLQFMGFE